MRHRFVLCWCCICFAGMSLSGSDILVRCVWGVGIGGAGAMLDKECKMDRDWKIECGRNSVPNNNWTRFTKAITLELQGLMQGWTRWSLYLLCLRQDFPCSTFWHFCGRFLLMVLRSIWFTFSISVISLWKRNWQMRRYTASCFPFCLTWSWGTSRW